MEKIYNNLNIENLMKTEMFNQLNKGQTEEVLKGLENNVNVLIYANNKYSWQQMKVIRKGLEKNFDINILLKEEFSFEQLLIIEDGFEKNINILNVINNKLTREQIKSILNCYLLGLKVEIKDFI